MEVVTISEASEKNGLAVCHVTPQFASEDDRMKQEKKIFELLYRIFSKYESDC